jgi:hypothetical protein
MAQIDPNIALGFRMPQIQDPLAATARAQDIGVNALKMQEYQRGIEQENKLRELIASGADLNSPETLRQMYSISPKMGTEFEKSRATIKKETLGAQKTESELVDARLKQSSQLLNNVTTPDEYIAWHEANHRDPVLGPLLASRGITAEQSRAKIMASLNQPGGFQRLINESKLGVQKFAEMNTISAAQQQTADLTRRGQDITREGQRLQYDPTVQGQIAGAKTLAQEAAKREVAGNIDVTSNRKALAQAGYDVSTGKDDITDLIKKSTGSYIGKGVDISGRLVGTSTEGSKALAALEQKANAITFGLLNGKLGAGISKSDAELVASLVGRLGDGTLPVDDRLAAWDSAKTMMKNLGMVAKPTGSPKLTPPSGAKPTSAGKTPALPSGFTLD